MNPLPVQMSGRGSRLDRYQSVMFRLRLAPSEGQTAASLVAQHKRWFNGGEKAARAFFNHPQVVKALDLGGANPASSGQSQRIFINTKSRHLDSRSSLRLVLGKPWPKGCQIRACGRWRVRHGPLLKRGQCLQFPVLQMPPSNLQFLREQRCAVPYMCLIGRGFFAARSLEASCRWLEPVRGETVPSLLWT